MIKMSHFYGTLQGSRGEATRGGSKDSGMTTYCASWEGAIRCQAVHDKISGKDMVRVEKVTWQGAGENKLLYQGLIGKSEEKLKGMV
jgi:hypothetical protein